MISQTELIPRAVRTATWNNTWSSTEGIGQYFAGNNTNGLTLFRGGTFDMNTSSGVFAANMTADHGITGPDIGFRCVYRP